MNRTKRISFAALLLFMLVIAAIPCLAATKKAIKKVSIRVDGTITAGEEVGTEDISVTASGTGYTLSHWDVQNQSFEWSGGEVPEYTIYLSAKDNYYFNITKASQITLKGCTYKTAARQDSATTLAVTVTLPPVGLSIGEPDSSLVTEKGMCTWNAVQDAGSYEIRFMRDSAILGGTKTVGGEPSATIVNNSGEEVSAYSYDAMQYITKGGTYHFKVRAVHKDDPTVKGKWFDSMELSIHDEDAKKVAEEYDAIQSAGDWLTDGAGTKFRLPDGTVLTSVWRKIHGNWYYFGGNGYMAKGWTQLDGSWYYFDPETGVMWKNTTTPDGYNLGIDGRRY